MLSIRGAQLEHRSLSLYADTTRNRVTKVRSLGGGGWLGEKKIAAAAAVAVDAVILIWLHVLQWPQYVYKKEPTK